MIRGQEGQTLVKGQLHFKPSQIIVSNCMLDFCNRRTFGCSRFNMIKIHSSTSTKEQTKLIRTKLNVYYEAFQKPVSPAAPTVLWSGIIGSHLL